MKLTLLLLLLHGGTEVDHTIQMQTARIHFEEQLAVTPQELDRAIAKRKLWERFLPLINRCYEPKPFIQEIQLQPIEEKKAPTEFATV